MLTTLRDLTSDGWLLFATRSIRLFAYGGLSVVLVFYLVSLGLTESDVGLLLTVTLLGDTLISLILTTQADRIGRRRMLIVGAALMAAAGLVFGFTARFWLLVIAGTIGVISPSGQEVGPFLSIEQAALSQVVSDRPRTNVFAWYTMAGSLATALGALAASALTQALQTSWAPVDSHRAIVIAYSAAPCCQPRERSNVRPFVRSLRSKCLRGIDPCRAKQRYQCRQGHCDEHGRGAHDERAGTEIQDRGDRGEQAEESNRDGQPHGKADQSGARRLNQHPQDDLPRAGAEGHADAELALPLGHQERDHGVRPRVGKQQADNAEYRYDQRNATKAPGSVGNTRSQREQLKRRVRCHPVHGSRHSQRYDVVVCTPADQERHVRGTVHVRQEIDTGGIDAIHDRAVGYVLGHADDLNATTRQLRVPASLGNSGEFEGLPDGVEPRPNRLSRRFADERHR